MCEIRFDFIEATLHLGSAAASSSRRSFDPSLEYDLAPENPFIGPINQALQAYEWLLRDGHRNIAVMGESAVESPSCPCCNVH
ncbi:hypothetical protein Ae201684_009858 [Aphanomyces euteiches]|uniref:Alpha/beta hydrolase fold-3 domain-containing protein n=1 Tax=Aphanomyces euteiches TaxID=100861 RepID=A0A6G0WZI1_9STRA|nr:hypothetical protein Ae201684_009858 [Aphanomyces euteiches]